MPIFRMRNQIQPYAWGSRTSIPEILGIPNPDGAPMAELWMGAHPKAPSTVEVDGDETSLLELINREPESMVGQRNVRRFGVGLPFLFKVLSAEQGLSIQSHPSKRQAEEGFAREDAAGIPRDAPNRNYRDDNHKPELICALTDFWGLRGFRAPDAIAADFDRDEFSIRRVPTLRRAAATLRTAAPDAAADTQPLRTFFEALMRLDPAERSAAIQMAVSLATERLATVRRNTPDDGPGTASAEGVPETAVRFYWLRELAVQFPGDIGVLAPLYLNCVHLEPGCAMFLPAGTLHAYLRGTGVELMANSDNVLRCGCTVKHVDLSELLKTVVFAQEQPATERPKGSGPFRVYESAADEFQLSVAETDANEVDTVLSSDGAPSIFLCVSGSFTVEEVPLRAASRSQRAGASGIAAETTGADWGESVRLSRGESAFSPAAVPAVRVRGRGVLFRASVKP